MATTLSEKNTTVEQKTTTEINFGDFSGQITYGQQGEGPVQRVDGQMQTTNSGFFTFTVARESVSMNFNRCNYDAALVAAIIKKAGEIMSDGGTV